jgi:hypothetical protein
MTSMSPSSPPDSNPVQHKWLRPPSSSPIWYRRLATSFRRSLLSEHLTDVTLVCAGDTRIRAHRLLLARCSPFLGAIMSPPDEDLTVCLPDVDGDSVRLFVDALYLGCVPGRRRSFLQLREMCALFRLPLFGHMSGEGSSATAAFAAEQNFLDELEVVQQAPTGELILVSREQGD